MQNDNPTRTVHDVDGYEIDVYRWFTLGRVNLDTGERSTPLGHVVLRVDGNETHLTTQTAVHLARALLEAVQDALEANPNGGDDE